MNIQPVTLTGAFFRLEPLSVDHLPALVRVGLDPALWRWIPTPVTTAVEMQAYVALAAARYQIGDFEQASKDARVAMALNPRLEQGCSIYASCRRE